MQTIWCQWNGRKFKCVRELIVNFSSSRVTFCLSAVIKTIKTKDILDIEIKLDLNL